MLFAECLAQRWCQLLDQLCQDELLWNDELLPAEREQLLADARGAIRGGNHVLDVGRLGMIRAQRLEHEVPEPEYHCHLIVDLVGNSTCQGSH